MQKLLLVYYSVRGVIEFVLFVASILKMRFTFFLIAQNIHQLETTFFNKIDNRIPNYKHIPISTLIIQLMNSNDYYPIIYMKKLLDSDWLRAVQFKCNTSAKSVTPVQKV